MTSPDDLVVDGRLRIPAAELEWTFTTSGGPGGQHANRARTRAEVRFDVDRSEVLDDEQRRRIRVALGSPVVVSADGARSQHRNRQDALERLGERLAAALREQPVRRPTRPGRGARERRLEDKRRQARKKRDRRPPDGW